MRFQTPLGSIILTLFILSIAYMELYAVLAYIFSHFTLDLVKDQSQKGIEWADRIVARATSNLKIKVVEDRWA